jgi:hypothetical protein
VLRKYLVHSTYGIFVPEATKDGKIVKPAVGVCYDFGLTEPALYA